MTRSTPLDQLQNRSNENNMAFEENENQLVSEILKEIEESDQAPTVQNLESTQEHPPKIEQQIEEPTFSGSFMEENIEEDNISFYQNVINNTKMPLLVGLITVILSVPQLNNFILNLVSNSVILSKYSTLFILLIKFVLGLGLFYFGKQNL